MSNACLTSFIVESDSFGTKVVIIPNRMFMEHVVE